MKCTNYTNGTRCEAEAAYWLRCEYKRVPGCATCEKHARATLDEYAEKLDDGWKWDAVPVNCDGHQVQGHAPDFHEVLRGKAYSPPKKHATEEEWNASGLCLRTYLNVGDTVDDELRECACFFGWYCVLPPATWSGRCIQIGEAAAHDGQGRPTFATLQRFEKDGPWVYMGEIATPEGEVCSYD